MNKRRIIIVTFALIALLVMVLYVLTRGHTFAVFETRGLIATKQRQLIVTSILLMLIVVIPVFLLTTFISIRYRATNKKAKYYPDWDHNKILEGIWWAIPMAIIFVLAVLTWQSSHQLDPFKPLDSAKKPITIQVVAMQWKWLFIYPEQHVASVNQVAFPKDTPVNFVITSDAPMNSFWIPQLGGQVYAMSGMSTQLHLIADKTGTFNGVSANISGTGFSGMRFDAVSMSEHEFDGWVTNASMSRNLLDTESYQKLADPSQNNPITYYATYQSELYDTIVHKYMHSDHNQEHDTGGEQ